ncbi:hypothetical protein VTI74DRAFT_564 [Chaetomium olivicolor]
MLVPLDYCPPASPWFGKHHLVCAMSEPTFHPFPRLPLELRQKIWELSVEPREVVIRCSKIDFEDRQPTPPPPLLLACAESRSYIRRFYTRAFLQDDQDPHNPSVPSKHYWINFDIDEVCMMDHDFKYFSAIPQIQRMIIASNDSEYFYRFRVFPFLQKARALESLTVLNWEGAPVDQWWEGWITLMEDVYFTCDPASFNTIIVNDGNKLAAPAIGASLTPAKRNCPRSRPPRVL